MKIINRIIIPISLSLILITLGCATANKVKETHVPPHSHYYPFTEGLGEKYHVRLLVDHQTGEAALVFEDISEKPIKLLRLRSIKGKALLPDGTVKEEMFWAVKGLDHSHWTHRRAHPVFRSKKRRTGTFTTSAEWIKTTPKFKLQVAFPFKGSDHELTFRYEVPGGKIPFHRK